MMVMMVMGKEREILGVACKCEEKLSENPLRKKKKRRKKKKKKKKEKKGHNQLKKSIKKK